MSYASKGLPFTPTALVPAGSSALSRDLGYRSVSGSASKGRRALSTRQGFPLGWGQALSAYVMVAKGLPKNKFSFLVMLRL